MKRKYYIFQGYYLNLSLIEFDHKQTLVFNALAIVSTYGTMKTKTNIQDIYYDSHKRIITMSL